MRSESWWGREWSVKNRGKDNAETLSAQRFAEKRVTNEKKKNRKEKTENGKRKRENRTVQELRGAGLTGGIREL